jgi:hypothetical protein
MNANLNPGFRAWASAFCLATGLVASGTVLAEVGVATRPGEADPTVVYILDDLTEDPSPISGVWRKFDTVGGMHVALNPGGEGNGDGTPSLLKNPSTGLVAAAWARNSASGFDVVVSRFDGGAWTEAAVVVGSTGQELDPQLVLDPDGSVHLFYWVDGTAPQVFHRVAPPDLSSWSTAEPVSPAGQSACRPAGAFYNGVLYVAYELHSFGNGNTPKQVVLARYENGGYTPEVVAMTNNLGNVRPEVHSHAGRLWVDWIDYELTDGSGEIAWTRHDAQGQWEAIQYDAFANHLEREYLVRGGVRLEVIH